MEEKKNMGRDTKKKNNNHQSKYKKSWQKFTKSTEKQELLLFISKLTKYFIFSISALIIVIMSIKVFLLSNQATDSYIRNMYIVAILITIFGLIVAKIIKLRAQSLKKEN